uniref:Uncharacterized protein n=1 Tax=Oryza punctata TaxID=4537 RepID=A0A0E0KME8_ORYPU
MASAFSVPDPSTFGMSSLRPQLDLQPLDSIKNNSDNEQDLAVADLLGVAVDGDIPNEKSESSLIPPVARSSCMTAFMLLCEDTQVKPMVSADKNNIVDADLVHLCVTEARLQSLHAFAEQINVQLLDAGPG